jgi:hypothetical protein
MATVLLMHSQQSNYSLTKLHKSRNNAWYGWFIADLQAVILD